MLVSNATPAQLHVRGGVHRTPPRAARASFHDPRFVEMLEVVCRDFKPKVVYLDVLRKLVKGDVARSKVMAPFLETLDRLREEHVIFRVLCHCRKKRNRHRDSGITETAASQIRRVGRRLPILREGSIRTSRPACQRPRRTSMPILTSCWGSIVKAARMTRPCIA